MIARYRIVFFFTNINLWVIFVFKTRRGCPCAHGLNMYWVITIRNIDNYDNWEKVSNILTHLYTHCSVILFTYLYKNSRIEDDGCHLDVTL